MCLFLQSYQSGCQYSYAESSFPPYIAKSPEEYNSIVTNCLIKLRGTTNTKEIEDVATYNVILDKTIELLRCIDIDGGVLENNIFYVDRFSARSVVLTGYDYNDIFRKCINEGALACFSVPYFKYAAACAFSEQVWQPLSVNDLRYNFDQCWLSSGIVDENNVKYCYAINFVSIPEFSKLYNCIFQMNKLIVGDEQFGYHFATYRISRQYYGNMQNPVAYLLLRQCFNEDGIYSNNMELFRIFKCMRNRLGPIAIAGSGSCSPGIIDVRSNVYASAMESDGLKFSSL